MSEQVLTTAFVQLRTKILQFATRFFPAEDDADDALQDAFCRLWSHRDEIKTINEAEALAKTTVRNLAIDSYRRRNALPTDDIETVAIADASPPADERESCCRRAIPNGGKHHRSASHSATTGNRAIARIRAAIVQRNSHTAIDGRTDGESTTFASEEKD